MSLFVFFFLTKPQNGGRLPSVDAYLYRVATPLDGKENDQEYKTIWYEKLTPVLVEAIKEQQGQIDELKALVAQLMADK